MRKHKTQESQEVSPFPADDHKYVRTRQISLIKMNVTFYLRLKMLTTGPAGCRPLNFFTLDHLSFRVRVLIGAAYPSLGRTKVLCAIFPVLPGAKVKFQQRKPSVLVALDEISEKC